MSDAVRTVRSVCVLAMLCVAAGCSDASPPDAAAPPPPPRAAPEQQPARAVRPDREDAELVRAFRALGGPLASQRDRARERLAEHGATANDAAVRSLAASNAAERCGAAEHLALHGTAQQADAVLAALAAPGTDEAVRVQLIAALGRIATPACVTTLVDIAEADDEREAFLAGDALAKSGADLPRERLLAMAGMGNPAHSRAAALTALAPAAAAEEAEIFRAAAVDFATPIRVAAAAGLVRVAEESDMRALVTDEDWGVRHAGLEALLQRDAEWVPRLAEAGLDDHDDDNQVVACEVLGARPDARSFDVLLGVLRNRRLEGHVRAAAARGLVAISPARAQAALKAVATEETGSTADACRSLLEEHGDEAR